MAKRKLSIEEQASSLQKRALHLNNKANLTKLMAALTAHPELLPAMLEHMERLGHGELLRPPQPKQLQPATPSPKKGVLMASPVAEPSFRSSASHASDTQSHHSLDSLDGEGDAGDARAALDSIPRKYLTFGSLPPHYLKELLTHMEPIAFGNHTLKGLLEPGNKTMPKKELLNLLEFVTDTKPEASISPVLRVVASMNEHFKHLNDAKGRRDKELELKVDWHTKGHFLIQVSGEGKAKIIAQHFGMEIELPQKIMGSITNPKELYVQSNWSVHGGTLKENGTALAMTIILVFPDLCAAMLGSEPTKAKEAPAAPSGVVGEGLAPQGDPSAAPAALPGPGLQEPEDEEEKEAEAESEAELVFKRTPSKSKAE